MEKEKTIHAKNREEWRNWLKKNHEKESKVALLKYKKHTGKPSLSHKESMDEAICFGWIDTTIKRIDDATYIRRFSKQNKNSRWSTATQSYAKQLIKEGKMAPQGLQFYKEGLKKPVIDLNLPKNPPVPEDLKQALEKNAKAKEQFASLAPSYKRTYLRWIERAKLRETRERRIKETVQRVAEKKKLGVT